ncbi:MAG: tetratricopeptide repeat protein [Myxococcales bacterium]
MPCLDENGILAFLDGSLPPAELEAARRHVDSCPKCLELLAAAARVDPTTPSDRDASTKTQLARGTEVGRYLLLDALGAGGMGVVYSAYDPTLARKVAVKLVRDDTDDGELRDEIRARLLREGKAVAKLSHPNVVAVHDMGTFADQVFIAMELVDGGTLRSWLRQKERSVQEILSLMLQAGAGLSAAHRAGLVHRDFKPDNVLMGSDGRVRVTDFGLARAVRAATPPPLSSVDSSDAGVTRAGVVVGTPAYMAPEQLRGDEAVDHRCDQFSFCVALWEALYGVRPFAGIPGAGELVTPKQTKVPPWLRKVLVRGLSVAPADRYPSLDALLEALAADPTVVRRRRVLSAAAALIVLAAVGVLSTLPGRSAQLCGGSRKLIDELWSPARQQLLREAFLATGHADAPQTFELVQQSVEDYASRWAAMRTEACEATRVRGTQSDEMLGRRMLCLERSRAGLRTLLDLFARPDPELVGKAPEALLALPSLRACADAEVLSAQVQPPSDLALAAKVEAVRTQLDEGRTLFHAGKLKQAREKVDAASKAAQELGYPPVHAEALEVLGRLQEEAGELRPAEESLVDALVTAQGARHDLAGARAAMQLVRVVGARELRFGEGRTFGRIAEALITRSGGDVELRADLDIAWGLLAEAEGKAPEAVERFRKALTSREKTSPNSLRLAEALHHLGSALRTMGQNAEALSAFQRSLALREKLAGPDSDLAATTRNGQANVLLALGRFEEALALYRRVLSTFERRLGPTHFRTAAALNNIAVTLAELGRFEEAHGFFEKSLAARIATMGPTSPKVAVSLCDVAAVELELGRIEAAQGHLEQAQKNLQPLPADDLSRAEFDLTSARLLLAKREAKAAVAPLERVIAQGEGKKGFRADYDLAQARFLLGRALWEAGKKDDRPRARELVTRARADLAALGAERFRRDLAAMDALSAEIAAR